MNQLDAAMAFRVIVLVSALLATDAYLWHGKYMRMAMDTAQGFGNDFNYQVTRLIRPLPRRARAAELGGTPAIILSPRRLNCSSYPADQ